MQCGDLVIATNAVKETCN